MSEHPLVSIIIPHQAGTDVLLHCLESVYADASYPAFEVLLVDNASSDGSVAAAASRFAAIDVVRLEENQGYAGGCNRGIERARGDYVLLLNDDTELEPGWLGELVAAAESDPSIAACQPKIRSLERRSYFEYSGAAGGLMDIYAYPFSRGRLMGHVEEDRGQYDDPIQIFWASGVCMLIRRSALDEAGAFDEVFFAYMEEIDLCWRLRLHGHRVVYVPTAVVYHIGGYSLDQRVLKRMYLNHRNSVIMLLKNYSARSLAWIVPVKIFLELFILFGALLRNPLRSRAVVKSFAWLATNVGTVRRLRAEVQASRRVSDAAIFPHLYLGMAPLWYFLFGIRQVTDLPDIDRVLHRRVYPDQKPADGEIVRPEPRDFLFAFLDQAPTGLALMRAVEARHFAARAYRRPILDLGCGGGVFARMLFNGVIVDHGVDVDAAAVGRARATRCFADVREGRIEALPYDTGSMATVFSNGALHAVAEIEIALAEVERVLRPGGLFCLTVPSPRCTQFLLWSRLLEGVGLAGLARRYALLTLRLFRAEHVDEPEVWRARLAAAGFAVETCEPYLGRRAAGLQDLFLPAATVSAVSLKLRGRLLLLPRAHRLWVRLYRRLLRGAYEETPTEGTGTFIVARKI